MQWLVMKLNPDGVNEVVGGGDHEIAISSKDFVKTIHQRESSADQAARLLASTNPGKQYAVFSVKKVYETAKPVFIEKVVNDAGELVVVTK